MEKISPRAGSITRSSLKSRISHSTGNIMLNKRNKLSGLMPTKCPQSASTPVEKCSKPLIKLAGGLGFEPRLTESESAVLPLDDPPETQKCHYHTAFLRGDEKVIVWRIEVNDAPCENQAFYVPLFGHLGSRYLLYVKCVEKKSLRLFHRVQQQQQI